MVGGPLYPIGFASKPLPSEYGKHTRLSKSDSGVDFQVEEAFEVGPSLPGSGTPLCFACTRKLARSQSDLGKSNRL